MDILCDLDDVMWDLVGHWAKAIRDEHGADVKPEEITDWNICQFYPGLTKEQVYGPLYESWFFHGIKPISGARETIARLIWEGDSVFVVTATHYKTVGYKIEEMLKLFPMLSWQDVFITTEKDRIRGDVLIDDSADNVRRFIASGRPAILFTRPHNKDEEICGAYRCNSWDEIHRVISTLECQIDYGKRWFYEC